MNKKKKIILWITGIVVATIFFFTDTAILYEQYSYFIEVARYAIPIVILATLFFVTTK